MPQNAPAPSSRGHSHVSIFDRRGTRSGRGRIQGGKPGTNANSHTQSSGFRGGQHAGAHGDDGSGVGSSAVFNKTCMLRIHDESFSTSDLVLNPLFFPGIRVGDVVEIRPLVDSDSNGDLTSPRISMDNSSVSGAHSSDSVNAAKTKALSQTSSKAGGNSSSGAAAAATGTTTTTTTTTGEAGETGAESVSVSGSSRDGDGSYRASHRKHPETENRQSFLARASKATTTATATATATTATTTVTGEFGRRGVVGEASRFNRPLVPNVPKVPHRWKGAPENDTSAPTAKPRPSRQRSSNPKDNGSDEGVEAVLQPDPRREIILQVGEVRKDTQQLQASMSSIVARIMWGEYSTNQRVDIRKINMNSSEERESIRADFVEISFRDQYVGRSDMWRLWRHLSMNVLYNYKTANMEGLIRAKVRRIYKNNVQVPCGYIDSSTQPIFRSESGRFIILIQMSEEMWAYQEDGNLCFEKAVNCFLADLFKRWRMKQLNHMVTIVMFSRWYYHVRDSLFFQDLVYDDHSGLYYRDYYKVVADMEVHQDWSVLLPEILSEFNTYRRDIQELCTQTGHRLRGDLSKASQGNILEAINMGINSFATNHVDRDLSRTGLSTIVITPSFGVFDVQKRLLRMTTERMLHFGIRVDLVCLAAQPLFRPPVFQFKSMLVPSEQEQRRALLARARARIDARRAKDTELNSVSPHAESPGAYANVVPGPFLGNTAKERAAKGVTAPDREATVTVDPIMLDPLYFDDDKWETKILPYLSGQLPRDRPASGLKYVRNSTWQYGPPTDGSISTTAERSSSVPNQKRNQTDAPEPWTESIVQALLPENDNANDMPDTIRGLTMSDFSYFCERDGEKKKDRRVTYCYFPYWIDCGFYNYTDESPTALKGNFRPSCKMGDLSVTGVPRYLRDTPLMPDLKLKRLDMDLASLLGGDSMTGSDLNSPIQDDESQSIDGYRFSAQTKEFSHGSIALLGQQPSITEEERERMIEVFRMYDHEALVSTGSTRTQPPPLLDSGSTAPDAPSSLSLLAAHMLTTSTTETRQLSEQTNVSQQSSQGSNAPANVLAQWDEAHATPALESKSTSAEKADGVSTGSAENIGHMAATVSASASPNLGPGQHIKPPARPEQPQAMSLSVPHEPKVVGPGSSGQSNQRTSIFVRSSNVAHRKRSQQLQVEHSMSSPGKPMATSATTTGTNEAAGGSGLKQPDKQRRLSPSTSSPPSDPLLASAVSIGGHGNSVEAANRQHLQRISESPAPISQSQINAMASGTDKPSSGASAADSTARSDRMGVSESIARQSHLDDHVRTFKGIGNQEQQQFHGQSQQQPQQQQQQQHRQQQQQQQQQPSSHHHPILNHQLQVGAIAMPSAGPLAQRHLGFNGGIAGESDFQLTLPGRKQVTPVGAVLTQPPVPSEYNSSSPQNPKAAWLTDRVLLTHVPESSPRGLRRGYYYPYNPCNPALYPLPHTELSQRWAFAFANYSSLSSYTPKWRSLCTPASLPLVTDYFPTDLETYYQLYTYHLQTPDIAMEDLIELPPEDFAEFVPFMAGRAAAEAAAARYRDLTGESARIDQSTRIMLKEMIYQRLAQGFQFIATRESRATRGIRDITARAGARAAPLFKSGNRSDTGGDPYMPVVPVGLIDKLDESVWLSNGREIQKLEFHNGTNTSHVPGVNVSRWERKKPYDRADVEYRFQMWSRSNNMGYGKANVRFTYPREDEVNWNNLDYLLNGYQNAPLKSMKYWRARYILIPVDQLSNDTFVNAKANPHMSIEDVRIANFEKFLDHIIRRLRKSDKADLEEAFLGALPAEMRRSVLGQQQQQQPATTTQAQQKPGSNGGSSESQKLIGLQDIVPSALLQIRYTSLCPIAYNNNQLHCYMNDKIYSDPSNKIVLPPPVTSALGLSVPLNVESPFSQLAFALQHPVAGIALRNIRWHTSYFEAAFISFQLVDWALVNFESAMKRTQAATLANRLLERGLICSLNKPGPFADGYYFYAFTDAAVAWKSQPIHQQQAPRTHASLISSIGFSDLGGRNGSGGSNAASPCVSRPESRQGSNAPSVANDADSIMAAPSAADSPALTTAATFEGNVSAAHNNSSSSGTTSVVSNANNKSNDTGSAPLMRRQTTASRVPGQRDSVQESQSDTRSAGAQPASRLRVRTDTPASATQVNVERKDMSGEGASSRGDGSANMGDGDRSTRDKGRLVQSGNNTTPMSTLVIAPGERRAIEAAAGQKVPSPALASKEGGYTRAPDVFPCLSQRKTRRPLPKSLTQSRMFALDLDQQRKSTRIEQCLVHLDATQNPMTCFHLSINWLNCTSHLIDELVQGWGRVAERCGMRLVEAPRAQDSYAHENHPFHSPLRINLVLAPPPVDEIFDDAWIAEFTHYGDDDSEPDEYTSESEESDVGFHTAAEQSELEIRTRILRRLKRSIPSYPFERELLEEHDFILDVEAESEFPSSSLLQREYTFERAEHKYTQYIHRSGTAFVRICGPGKYMWINNYLLTSHQGHLRPQASQTAQQTIPATGAGTAAGGAAAAAAASGGVQQQQHQQQQPGAMGAFGLHGDGVMAGLAGTAPPGLSDGGLMATIFDSEGLGLSSAYGLETAGSLVPSYYPVHQSRGMWPHQMLMSLSLYRSPSRRFHIPELYSVKIVDNLGEQPADFDSVNAAITRVAVMRKTLGARAVQNISKSSELELVGSYGPSEISFSDEAASFTSSNDFVRSPDGMMFADRMKRLAGAFDRNDEPAAAAAAAGGGRQDDWAGATTPPAAMASEPNPDILRSHFIETCGDRNGLEMFWQRTIDRYRSGWRDYMKGSPATIETPKQRPMVVDMFTESMWQHRRNSSKQPL